MSRRRWRNLKLTGLWLLAILLLLCLAVAGSAFWLLGTGSGGRWLLDRVPGLSYGQFDGALAGQWQLDQLDWQSDGMELAIEGLDMDWSPSCLFRPELCLHHVRVETVAIQTRPDDADPGQEAGEEPFSLPEIDSPIPVNLDQLQVGRLTLNDTLVVENVAVSAQLTGHELQIEQLQLAREALELQLTGQLSMTGVWPLEARLNYRMPLVDEYLAVDLQARGSLERNLQLDAEVEGYVAGSLSGMVQPLAPGVPAELTARPSKLPVPESVPAPLHPRAVEIRASGNLDEGWAVEAEGELPAEDGPMPLAILGHATTSGARVDEIRLNGEGDGSLQISGDLDWSSGFAAQLALNWRYLPWQRLLPGVGPLPVDLQTLTTEVDYDNGSYQGELDAAFTGPAGDSTLSTPFRGDLSRIHLPELALDAGPGGIAGELELGFADPFSWRADLEVSDLNPGFWLEQLPGRLNGRLNSQGELQPEGPALDATIDLQGELRQQPARLQLQADSEGATWQADSLLVQLGDNRVTGQARQAEQLAASLRLDLPRLEQLWPGLSGNLQGSGDLNGWPDRVEGDLQLDSGGLEYDQIALEPLTLALALNPDQPGGRRLAESQFDLVLETGPIRFGEQEVEQLEASVRGTPDDHRIAISVTESRGDLALTFDGASPALAPLLAGLDGTGDAAAAAASDEPAAFWAGTLSNGDIRFARQHWQLAQPAALTYHQAGTVELGSHCWTWRNASLCSQDQRLWPEPRIRLALDELPTRLARPFLPRGFRWRGTINGEVSLDLEQAGPRGQISLDAGPGRFIVRDPFEEEDAETDGEADPEQERDWTVYHYDIMRISADLDPDQVTARARFAGPDLGELEAEVELDQPRAEVRPLQGRFQLQSLNLAVFRPFAQVQDLTGAVNGSGQIGGTLTEPEVQGVITLEDGRLADRRLPLQFEELGLSVQFNERGARVTGDWRSGPEGRGQVSGNVDWQDELSASIAVTGERLAARLEPFAQVEVAPDIRVVYGDEQLEITGQVAIPRGAVEIRELPPQAVTVSSDTVVVGRETDEPAGPGLDLRMDLDVIVGEDELTFDGFGVTGELAGRLNIGDSLDTRGELRLEEGRYEMYGQELTLRRANLIFAGPIGQPFLEIEAIRRVDDVTAGIRITGPADRPDTEVFAEPSMSEEQALSYLILGRPLQSEQDNNVVGSAAISIGLNQAAPLTRAIGQRFGVEDFQLETEGSGQSQRIVASGYITDKLSVRYGVSLFEAANRLALRYELSQRLYLEAASGLASSLDIFYSRDYR